MRSCSDVPCTKDMFKCPMNYCIPAHKVCNGVSDCPYSEDEVGCVNRTCTGMVRCRSGLCVSLDHVCDGIPQCPVYEDDEEYCDLRPCPSDCSCLERSVVCFSSKHINSLVIWRLVSLHNFLSQVPDQIITRNLIALNLSLNFITHISEVSLQGGVHLIKLDLSSNSIFKIEGKAFFGVRNLRYLSISRNPLIHISPQSLSNLPNIRYLDFSHTHLLSVDSALLDVLPNLHHFSLRNSLVSTVKLSTKVRISYVDISYTPMIQFQLDGSQPYVQVMTTHHWVCCLIGSAKCVNQFGDALQCLKQRFPTWLLIVGSIMAALIILMNLLGFIIDQGTTDPLPKWLTVSIQAADVLGSIPILVIIWHELSRLSNIETETTNFFRSNACAAAVAIERVSLLVSVICSAICGWIRYRAITSVHRQGGFGPVMLKGIWLLIWSLPITLSVVPHTHLTTKTATWGPACSHLVTDDVTKGWYRYYNQIYSITYLISAIVLVAFTIRMMLYIERTMSAVQRTGNTLERTSQR